MKAQGFQCLPSQCRFLLQGGPTCMTTFVSASGCQWCCSAFSRTGGRRQGGEGDTDPHGTCSTSALWIPASPLTFLSALASQAFKFPGRGACLSASARYSSTFVVPVINLSAARWLFLAMRQAEWEDTFLLQVHWQINCVLYKLYKLLTDKSVSLSFVATNHWFK